MSFWTILLILIVILAWFALFTWAASVNIDAWDGYCKRKPWERVKAVGLAIATIVTAALLIWLPFRNNNGVHEWRGGSGPSTVCAYELRNEAQTVGKVTTFHDVTYTVCRDAR